MITTSKACYIYFMVLLLAGCQIEVTLKNPDSGSIISGIATPFVGGIAQAQNRYNLINNSYAAICANPVYARLYELNGNGTITDGDWKASQTLNSSARFSFNLRKLNLPTNELNVNYLVKVEGCNGEIYQRPITDFDEKQDIDFKTSIVANIVNVDHSLLAKNLYEASREEIRNLIKNLSGNTRGDVVDSLITETVPANLFTTIFGAPPSVILDAKPDVFLTSPTGHLNELQVSPFQVHTFHPDPNYSIAYSWKLDGVVKSSLSSLNYIPGANSQGQHQIEIFIGKDDGTNKIDTNKPYNHKIFFINVSNNIIPTAPAITLNSATPSPRTTNSIELDISTGLNMENCDSFSEMAISESSNPPGPMTFTLACTDAITQTETVALSAMDGQKSLYLWARDSSGNVSLPTQVNVVLDATAPVVALSGLPAMAIGGQTLTINYSTSDATTAIVADLYYANDGTNFTFIKNLNPAATTTTFTLPSDNTTTAKLKIIATDAAGNSTTAISGVLTIDSILPPAPTVILASNLYSQSTNLTLTATTCSTEVKSVLINEGSQPTKTDPEWQNCQTTPGGLLYTLATMTEGLHSLKSWSMDEAGNISVSATTVPSYLDLTPPALNFVSLPENVKGGAAQSFSLSLTEVNASATQEIFYQFYDGSSWSDVGTRTISDGPLSSVTFSKAINIPLLNVSGAMIRATYQDLAGRQTQITSAPFKVDSVAPVASNLSINEGATVTGNRNVLLTFSANDTLSVIDAFCIKYNSTTMPSDADTCWITMDSISETPAEDITITKFPFQVGSIQGDYVVRLWFKDSAGNISNNSDSTQVDSYTITFNPDPPPSVSNFISSSTDTPSAPLTTADTTVPVGDDVYIRWNLTDNLPIPNGNLTLSYTTDDTTYTTIATGLNNDVNSGCGLSAGTTGCYKWSAGSPSSAYFRIKLVVTDSAGTVIYEVSNPINTGPVKFLSGNTSLGIGASATNAILLSASETNYNDAHDGQAFVVTKTGYIFYRFYNRGLVYISPEDGILKDLMPITGTSSGDGGSVFNATLKSPTRMILDYQDNLLVWDDLKIRKIDLSTTPWTITTLFGGGADSSDGAPATAAFIGSGTYEQITVTPNGRVYYNKSNSIWYYDPTDQKVKKHITLTGIGTDDMSTWRATFDNSVCPGVNNAFSFLKSTSAITKIMRRVSTTTNSACGSAASTGPYYNTNFNLTTGVAEAPHPSQTSWSSFKFTGMDGNIYVMLHGRQTLYRYNPANNTFQTVLGGSGTGRCADGTPATACKAVIMSAFVSEFGRIYFLDLGVLRMVDSNGTVQTIAGQPRNFGVGFNPLSARYSQINFFDMNGDDIYIRNELENQIVKFSLVGGNLDLVAGNTARGTPAIGSDAHNSPLPNCAWSVPCSFIIDPNLNRLYHYANINNAITYIDLATNKWVYQAGSLQDGGTRVSYVGMNDDGLLTYLPSSHQPLGTKTTFRVFDQVNNTTMHIYGQDAVTVGAPSSICVGAAGTTCNLQHAQDPAVQTRIRFDVSTNNWLLTIKGSNSLVNIPSLGGTTSAYETLNNFIHAYDHYKSGADEFVFYCSTTGNLYKRNIATNVETFLPMPISSMKCDSGSIFYSSIRDSLIFAYKQNGLYGIAEYLNP